MTKESPWQANEHTQHGTWRQGRLKLQSTGEGGIVSCQVPTDKAVPVFGKVCRRCGDDWQYIFSDRTLLEKAGEGSKGVENVGKGVEGKSENAEEEGAVTKCY